MKAQLIVNRATVTKAVRERFAGQQRNKKTSSSGGCKVLWAGQDGRLENDCHGGCGGMAPRGKHRHGPGGKSNNFELGKLVRGTAGQRWLHGGGAEQAKAAALRTRSICVRSASAYMKGSGHSAAVCPSSTVALAATEGIQELRPDFLLPKWSR